MGFLRWVFWCWGLDLEERRMEGKWEVGFWILVEGGGEERWTSFWRRESTGKE